jgi:hypothetical protein
LIGEDTMQTPSIATLTLLLTAALLSTRSAAQAANDGTTHVVHAHGAGYLIGGSALPTYVDGGETLYFGVDLKGGGRLHGFFSGYLLVENTAYAGAPGQDITAISGAFSVATQQGQVFGSIDGELNVTTGAVEATLVIVAGSDKLEGATGALDLTGRDDPLGGDVPDLTFEVEIAGQLGLPK